MYMNDDRKPNDEQEEDEQETNEAEVGHHKTHQGQPDSAAPADDDIIIK
jgi:hypothetical protein